MLTRNYKALRGTARNYLKSALANAEKSTEPTPSVPPTESQEKIQNQAPETPAENGANGTSAMEEQVKENIETAQANEESAEPSTEVVQSIEVRLSLQKHDRSRANETQEPTETSRRDTLGSASGNEPDDEDIEINVGPDYDLSQVPDPKQFALEDEQQLPQEQQYHHEQPRKNSTKPQKQDQSSNNSFNYDNNNSMPPEAQMNQMQQAWQQANGPDAGTMPNMSTFMALYCDLVMFFSDPPPSVNANPAMFAQMQMNFNSFQQMMQMNPAMMNMMGPGMQNFMQNMGMPPMGFNGNQGWAGNMMPFGNQNFNPVMNNGASFNQGQYNQNNFANGNFRNDRQGSFTRGRGGRKGRGRGGYYQQQDQYQGYQNNNNNNYNMPYQNQYGQGPNYLQNQYDHQAQDAYPTNNDKEIDQHADDDDFAPGGQDEVQEALGESYKKKESEQPEEAKAQDEAAEEIKQENDQEPSTTIEQRPMVESPKQELKEEYIPEAYREDLDTAPSVPFSAPLGPSAKDVPFRARGHGRFPSRGRGSYQGSNGYPPRSPARPVSQQQNVPPSTNQMPGVVGAPTGPRAMREKDAPAPKAPSRAESDVGLKIRGTANKPREDLPRSATPRSMHDDYDDRDRDSSRRHSKYDRKESTRYNNQTDGYGAESERERRRRKSRREDDYDYDHEMQDAEYSHSRSDSQDRDTSRRNGHSKRDKDKPRDKYSSSTSKHKSSRRHEDEYYDDDATNDYGEDTTSRSRTSKKSTRHEEKDERRDRDYERAEKDKHRKRSRHDRDRDDGYEDADEEESRRRSRKHKKEHVSSSRKDRDRERDRERDRDETDIGMRITGRSHTSHRSDVATPTKPAADKDPHTLEREARNRERMLKEQQRRENAAKGSTTLSGGRKVAVKYEDELDGSLSSGRLKGDGYSKRSHRR
ncbi:hypothetical protein OHC33_010543 [Knufia fluminis]|uniref:Uncharacterized protein n=1 Tax=Knufia fluminis TaxID=191047 RepID=A0AAN8E816_9EURO|nr:hypothetical protein OHC33_010543 [Knufia fluminis]